VDRDRRMQPAFVVSGEAVWIDHASPHPAAWRNGHRSHCLGGLVLTGGDGRSRTLDAIHVERDRQRARGARVPNTSRDAILPGGKGDDARIRRQLSDVDHVNPSAGRE